MRPSATLIAEFITAGGEARRSSEPAAQWQ